MAGRPARDDAPRYETLLRLAAGGMATVYVGTVRGALGFRQLVAIKKPHAHLLESSDFRRELVTEARLASLLHHAHVVDVRDVEATKDEVSLIMDYVEGASLGELLQVASAGGPPVAAGVAVRIVLDACTGLQAAHELCDERGRPLHLIHRDISPQNLLVGVDGVTRVADFGIAKFDRKSGQSTTDGNLKGKLAYMAPEYLRAEGIDRRLDVFAMGVVLWEALTGQRLFRGQHEADTLQRILQHTAPPVSSIVPALGTGFDAIVDTALAKSKDHRFDNAAAMANALESCARAAGMVAAHREVADLVLRAVGTKLEERRALIRDRLAHEPSVASAMVEPPGDTHGSTRPTPTTRTSSDSNASVTAPEPIATPASTERSPPPALAPDPLRAKPVPTTLKSEPAYEATPEKSATVPAATVSTAEVRSSRTSRTARNIAFVFLGGLVVAGAVAALLREPKRVPADPIAAGGTIVSSATALPVETTPSAAPVLPEVALKAPAPAASSAAVLATAPAPSTSAKARSPRPSHRVAPSAAPLRDGDPPPNPYASP